MKKTLILLIILSIFILSVCSKHIPRADKVREFQSGEIKNGTEIEIKTNNIPFMSEFENGQRISYEVAKDNNGVYLRLYRRRSPDEYINLTATMSVDPVTIKSLANNIFKDKNAIYFENMYSTRNDFKKVECADPSTFVVLNKTNAEDKYNLYTYDDYEIIVKRKNLTLARLYMDWDYFKNETGVYIIRGCGPVVKISNDSKTFESIGDYFAKDKNKAYYWSDDPYNYTILEMADSATFKYNNSDTASDKNHKYRVYFGKLLIDNEVK